MQVLAVCVWTVEGTGEPEDGTGELDDAPGTQDRAENLVLNVQDLLPERLSVDRDWEKSSVWNLAV